MATWWKRPPRLNLLRRLLPYRRLSQPRRPNLFQYLSRRLHHGLNLHPPLNQHKRLSQPRRPNLHRQRSKRRNRSLKLNHRRCLRLPQRLNRRSHLRRNRRLPLLLNRRLLNHQSPPQRQSLSQLPNLRLHQNRASPPG